MELKYKLERIASPVEVKTTIVDKDNPLEVLVSNIRFDYIRNYDFIDINGHIIKEVEDLNDISGIIIQGAFCTVEFPECEDDN